MGKRRTLWAVLCWAACAWAQQAPPARTVVHAGRLLEVKTGRVLTEQNIVIEGGKITEITAGSAPAGAQVINLPDATVLPGLIDVHTHLTFDPGNLGMALLTTTPPREALRGAKNARLTLEAGFTTVRNVGATGFADVALRDAINDGDVPGPRMLVSGPALGITGGHCDENVAAYQYHITAEGVADGVDAVRHKVRENIKYGADLIKVCATGGVLSKGDNPEHSQYTLEELKAIVEEAHRLGRKVAAHAHSAEGIRWAALAGVDSVEHASYLDDAGIAEMKKDGTYVVPTLYLGEWFLENAERIHAPAYAVEKARTVIPEARKNLQHAFASGAKVALGTDSAVYPHGLNAHELATYVSLGMTPVQAIQTATVNAAGLLGWSDRVGTLEPARWADIIAVDGDPTRDVSTLQHVKFVMKGGKVYKNEYAK